MEKHVLFLTNGYGEDSFAQLIASAFIEEAYKRGFLFRLSFLPLVGEGKALQNLCQRYPEKCFLLHRSPAFRYGGVYLGNAFQRSLRFIHDTFAGGIQNFLQIARLLTRVRGVIDANVVIGDAFLVLLSSLFLRKKSYLFACAHTALLREKNKPYERLGRLNAYLFRTLTHKVYTRDALTAQWFRDLGINACYPGFVGPELPEEVSQRKVIIFLPGHRKDWKTNFCFLTQTIGYAQEIFTVYTPHFVFPPELTTQEIGTTIQKAGGRIVSPTTFLLRNTVVFWSQDDYFSRLREAILVVGFAGTALEYAAYLGIPCLEPYTDRAIQANRYFLEKRQQLLLREALIKGDKTPEKTSRILQATVTQLPEIQKRAKEFTRKTWQERKNGARYIAQDLINILYTPSQFPDREPAQIGSHIYTP